MDRMPNMTRQCLLSKLTTRVKNAIKKLNKMADDYNKLSEKIYQTSLQYHAASLALSKRGGPPPKWYVPRNQRHNPLNFFLLSSRNKGVVPLVTADSAKPPQLEPPQQQLQILQAPQVVKHPNDDNNYIGMDN
jgi:hypothetical protein